MEKFLLIPPVDKSLPPLRTGQWIFLLASFLVTITIFIIFLLTFPHPGIPGCMVTATSLCPKCKGKGTVSDSGNLFATVQEASENNN